MSIQLLLTRDRFTENSITGLLEVNGAFQCYILERPWSYNGQTNVQDKTCIPNGIYPVRIRWSPKRGFNVPGIENVPNRTDIEMHPANWPSQLEGCQAPGESRGVDEVYQSVLAFAKLMAKLKEPDMSITIKGVPPILPTDFELAT